MDNFVKKQLYVWAYDKLKENPQKFGGDLSNAYIQVEYAKEFYNSVVDELFKIKTLVTISRIKNKLLEKNPDLDYRVKYKSKKKSKTSKNHLNNLPTKTVDR